MALDWSNERYVRLYTRITPDMALWCWQAKAIWPWLLAAADRAGVIGTRKGTRGIAALIGMPTEVVDAGIADLLGDGCIVATEAGYAIPNYVEAQTAQASPNKRAADYRARQRLGESLDSRNDADSSVTENHAPSRAVTRSNGASREITPSGTDPSGTERDQEREPAAPAFSLSPPSPPADPKPDPAADLAIHATAEINRATGRNFDPASKATVKLARALLRERFTAADVTLVVEHKAAEWLGTSIAARVCPATLLAADNFAKYLDEARAGPPKRAGPFPAGTASHPPVSTRLTLEDAR